MKRILSMVGMAGVMALAADAPMNGTWNVETDIMGNQGSSVCSLTQDGGKISGKCEGNGATHEVAGEVAGQKVTFWHGAEYEGQALTVTYTGTLKAAVSSFTGEVMVGPINVSGTFSAKKKE